MLLRGLALRISQDGRAAVFAALRNSPKAKVKSMKKQISRAFRLCMVAGLVLPVFATAADAAKMSGRQCRQEWRANKATYRSEGKTRRIFMMQCRGGGMQPAQPAPSTSTTH